MDSRANRVRPICFVAHLSTSGPALVQTAAEDVLCLMFLLPNPPLSVSAADTL